MFATDYTDFHGLLKSLNIHAAVLLYTRNKFLVLWAKFCKLVANSLAMKKLSFLPLIIFISFSANGQQFFGKINIIKVPGDSVKINVYAYNDRAPFNVPGSKFLFENNLGKVYQMAPDNMHCLVPNYRSNMPYFKIQPGGRFLNYQKVNPLLKPNSTPRLKIIPKG